MVTDRGDPRVRSTNAAQMVADLERAMAGEYASFSHGLTLAADHNAVVLDALLTPQRISAVLDRFNARFGRTDPRAIVSIWASWHFIAVMPSIIACNVLLDRSPVFDIDRLRFVVSPDLRVNEIVLGDDIVDVSTFGHDGRFANFVEGYLRAFVTYVAMRSGTSQRVLWSNAGSTFDAVLRRLAPLMIGRPGYAAAIGLLSQEHWHSGSPNPLFEPVRTNGDSRVRKICCMRFLVPDGRLCGTCPLDRSTVQPKPRPAA